MDRRPRRQQPTTRVPAALLLASVLLAAVSLATAVRVHALPVEAQRVEPWYAYQSSVGFDFLARVKPGKFYTEPLLRPDQIMRSKLPVEPPAYRRILISRFADTVEVQIPYRFQADRPAPIRARLRVDGATVIPGVWQKPYPLVAAKDLSVQGTELSGVETISIPVGSLLAEMEAARRDLGIVMEPLEVRILPTFAVEVAGLREPVQVVSNPEFLLVLRAGVLELDEPREVRTEKTLAQTRVVPVTLTLWGREIPVSRLRQVTLTALSAFAALALVLLWIGRSRRRHPRADLDRLGPGLIRARSFELPAGTALAEVATPRELLRLHVQTERPVIQVNDTYYLLDGTTCYRLTVSTGRD